jgi:hypothetical protein
MLTYPYPYAPIRYLNIQILRLFCVAVITLLVGCVHVSKSILAANSPSKPYWVQDPITEEYVNLHSRISKDGKWQFYLLRGPDLLPSNYCTNPFTLQTLDSVFRKLPRGKVLTWGISTQTPEPPPSIVRRVTRIGARHGISIGTSLEVI